MTWLGESFGMYLSGLGMTFPDFFVDHPRQWHFGREVKNGGGESAGVGSNEEREREREGERERERERDESQRMEKGEKDEEGGSREGVRVCDQTCAMVHAMPSPAQDTEDVTENSDWREV